MTNIRQKRKKAILFLQYFNLPSFLFQTFQQFFLVPDRQVVHSHQHGHLRRRVRPSPQRVQGPRLEDAAAYRR